MNWKSFLASGFGWIVIGVVLTFFVMKQCHRAEYIHPQNVDELVDSQTRAISAELVTERELREMAQQDSEKMAERIERYEERLITYNRIEGILNAYRDSVETLNRRLSFSDIVTVDEFGEATFRDTTFTHVDTYTDGLFEITCKISFNSSGCVKITSDLRQLRPVYISVSTAEYAPGLFNTYIHLADFDMEKTVQFSYQAAPARAQNFWKEYGRPALIGGGIVMLIRGLIELARSVL